MSSEAVDSSSNSISSFVTSFIFNGLTALAFTGLFLFLRPRHQRVYQPRSLESVKTVRKLERTEEVPSGYFTWVSFLLKKPHSYVIQHASVDGYFFLRYLIIFGSLSFIGCLILLPILLPLNLVGGNRYSGFERLSFANVTSRHRFFVHAILSFLFFGLVIYTIYCELYYYISMFQLLQLTPYYSSQIGSKTVIITDFKYDGNPEEGKSTIINLFSGVKHVVFARDNAELQKLVKERKKTANKYEVVMNKIINKSVKKRRNAEFNHNFDKLRRPDHQDDDFEKYITKRPTHTLGKIPWVGEKVDTLDYCLTTIGKLNNKIKDAQKNWKFNKATGACFIIFNTQFDAQRAYQSASAVLGNSSYDRCYIGYSPEDICWDNISCGRETRKAKMSICNAILVALIILWAIPVGFVGSISNINFLTEKISFLSFINNIPSPLIGTITGLLPSVALAILMSLVPIFIKKLAVMGKKVTRNEIELYCQASFYAFQVFQVFLVSTMSSSASSSVAAIINQPDRAMTLLSSNLPKASNFYISYFLLLGLLVPSGLLLQVVTLILSKVLGRFMDSTPRQKWNRYCVLNSPSWGVIYPTIELMVCIYLSYSIISPILLIFTTFAFVFFYLAHMYNLNYVMGFSFDLKGRNYVRALFQVFMGLYIAEICLFGLFIMAMSWGPFVLNVLLIAGTILSHLYMKRRFLPLVDAIPLSMILNFEKHSNFSHLEEDQGLSEVNKLGKTRHSYSSDESKKTVSAFCHERSKNQSFDSDNRTDATLCHDTSALERKFDDDLLALPNTYSGSITERAKSYFNPSVTHRYSLLISRLPTVFNTPVNYDAGYEEVAYTDPCVTDKEPIIWLAEDPMGIAAKQAKIAQQNGVSISIYDTGYDENGKSFYTGDPPSWDSSAEK